jgi:hypothetical protein
MRSASERGKSVIDASDPATWPQLVLLEVETISRRLIEEDLIQSGAHSSDLPQYDLDGHLEVDFRTVLASNLLLCYHATRLLPHEVQAIRKKGLSVLSQELRSEKLDAAVERYPELINAGDAEEILNGGPLAWQGTASSRLGRLFVVAPITIFRGDPGGFSHLLGAWGGEAVGWLEDKGSKSAEAIRRLTHVSLPTIIEVAIEPGTLADHRDIWPVFVGRYLGLEAPWQEWSTTASIAAERILAILQPGDTRWPLPRTRRPVQRG